MSNVRARSTHRDGRPNAPVLEESDEGPVTQRMAPAPTGLVSGRDDGRVAFEAFVHDGTSAYDWARRA